jgi:hypothetical protein
MKKYYTPVIEEFHIGFEFELEDMNDDFSSMVFRKCTLSIGDDLLMLNEWLKNEEIRVKLLDHADIEGLGWDYIQEEIETSPFWFVKNIFSEKHKKSIEFQLITQFNGWICISEQIRDTRFSGFIKNKSELLKLMNQLQIS